MLGLCLGAQLIARAFGGEVKPLPKDAAHTALPSSRSKAAGVEFGFHQQDFTGQAKSDRVVGQALRECDPDQSKSSARPVFMQWHSDTYTYPQGAVNLSSRPTCPVQSFRLGRCTYAFQYHIEVGTELGREWYKEYAEGTASHSSSGAEEAITSEADKAALESQLQQVLADGSIEKAERFTRSVMRSLLQEARVVRRERRERRCVTGAVAVGVAVGVTAVAMKLIGGR